MSQKSGGDLLQELIDATHAVANEARDDRRKTAELAEKIEKNTGRTFVLLLWILLLIPLAAGLVAGVVYLEADARAKATYR